MRPKSILMFERLFLASLVLSAISFVVGYDAMVEALAAEPGMAELGVGEGFAIGLFAVGTAIYLLLWFLIARKAVNAAKWVLIALVALSVVSLLSSLLLAFTFDLQIVIGLVVYALEVAAVYYLFREDAVAWFRGDGRTDPTTFD